MRLIPFVTALLVTAFLIGIVLYRDTLVAFAANPPWSSEAPAEDVVAEAPEAVVEASPSEDARAGEVDVVAMRSVAKEIDSAIILRGETQAARQVEVRSETSSTVISPPLRAGAIIEAGQLMCELDPGTRAVNVAEARARLAEAVARQPETEARIPEAEARIPEAQARLIEAEARLDEAQVNFNAAQKLQADGYASETRVKNAEAAVRSAEASIIAAEAGVKAAEAGVKAARSGLDSTKAAIQSAEAGVAAAEKEIQRLQIRAPFGGILETDTAELGTLLQPGALCGTVLQLDPITLVGFVPETQISRVKIGAQAAARLTTGAEVTGKVSFLARSADMQTRTFRVEIDVPNSDLAIRDGQTAEIIIAAPGDTAHLLPQSALTLDNEGALGVRIVADGDVAAFAPIRILRDTREGVWATGLPDEVIVITLGQEYVTDGVPVNVSFEEELQQ
ncbi:efflux RND transporter periplasmic adaptor subunit [Primorskyibacter sp. S187A]|uniref:efflux RND transporter periplasmic adaptor subunit n=1 Tax=Primorskyibacter sp. S187A TaxID=3415130 RepID=UPI003C7AD0B0